MFKGCFCIPRAATPAQYQKPAEADADEFAGHARLKSNSSRSMSILGNLVKEFEGSVWESYEQAKGAKLGRGAGGEVVEASHKKTKRKYAVKIINISNPKYHTLIENERLILQDLDHLNCVRLYEVYSIGLTQMWFVMELCTGGHLGQHIAARSRGFLSEKSSRSLATQLVSVVAHCHERKICHRDVKLANILMESKTRDASLKLIDFGNSSRFKRDTLMKRIAGTTYSTAPEVFQRKGYHERCDVWSIGVMVYIMLCGRRPFERIDIPNQPEASEASLISSILLGRFHFNHAPFRDVSDAAIHFICCCFEPYNDRRLSAQALMSHPWLASKDFKAPSEILNDFSSNASIHHDNSNTMSKGLQNDGASSELSVANSESQANYAKRTDFNRTSMLGVAFSIPPNKTREFRKLFQEMDTDNTGFLDRSEFFQAVKKATTGSKDTDVSGDVNALFDMMDIDGNNQLSFLEFLAATIDPRSVDIQDMNQAFRLLDKEERGYITVNDFKSILRTASNPNSRRPSAAVVFKDESATDVHSIDDQESTTDIDPRVGAEQRAVQEMEHMKELEANISRMIAEVDVDGDGRISYSEFLFAMSEMPKTNNFVPLTEKDVLANEQLDAMHKKRHLSRSTSDGAISQVYNNTKSAPMEKGKVKAKSGSLSGGGIFSVFNRSKSKGSESSIDVPAPAVVTAPKQTSSTSYFSQQQSRSSKKIHMDINWAPSQAPTDGRGDISSMKDPATAKH